jgi:predicted metal-dependent peptidase
MQKLIASLLQRSVGDSGASQSLQTKTELGQPGTMEACNHTTMDDHTFWEGDDEITGQQDVWLQRMINATDIVFSMGGAGRGTTPLAAKRIVEELKNPLLDWRTILHDFVQEEICDYSFSPPDKRMEDEPPVSIVILTDGFAPWPEEADAMGIPVLWIINNEQAQPPWGKVARLLEA